MPSFATVFTLVALLALAYVGFGAYQRYARRRAERLAVEEARLAPKRAELRRLKAAARGERYLLKPDRRERYAYQHYEEVRNTWHKILAVYNDWEADSDFDRLIDELDASEMVEVWEAKRQVKVLADDSTEAERKAWDLKQKRLFKEAHERGLTIQELETEKRAETRNKR